MTSLHLSVGDLGSLYSQVKEGTQMQGLKELMIPYDC